MAKQQATTTTHASVPAAHAASHDTRKEKEASSSAPRATRDGAYVGRGCACVGHGGVCVGRGACLAVVVAFCDIGDSSNQAEGSEPLA